MATFTAASFLSAPKQVHTGNQSRHFQYSGLALGTAGDTIYLAKIPNKATIVDCWARFASGYAAGTFGLIVTKGNTASATSILGTVQTISASTASQTLNMRSTVSIAPFQVSLSDDDAVQYAVLKFTVSTAMASASASVSLDGVVIWAMDAEA